MAQNYSAVCGWIAPVSCRIVRYLEQGVVLAQARVENFTAECVVRGPTHPLVTLIALNLTPSERFFSENVIPSTHICFT